MNNESTKIKERFDKLFTEWEKAVQDSRIRLSSRPQDYINNEPYHEIVKLGRGALPFLIEKLEQGVFFFNQAIMDIAGLKMGEITVKEKRVISEQEKSRLIIEWWKKEVIKMAIYRQKKDSDTWHWCRNCSNYPTSDYEERQSIIRPTTGELCNECLAKEKEGKCTK